MDRLPYESIKAGRPFHEGVDWNIFMKEKPLHTFGRPFHEGVDWNTELRSVGLYMRMSPFSRGRGLKYPKQAYC